MANTTLTQTGQQVQADLDKVEGLANIKTIGSGLSLSAGGELSASGGGGIGYNGTIYLGYSGLSCFVLHANGSCSFIDSIAQTVSLNNVSLIILINTARDSLSMCEFSNVCGYYQSKTGGYYHSITSSTDSINQFAVAFIKPSANNFDITLDD